MTTFTHNEGNDLPAGPAHPYSPSLLQLFNNFAHHLSSHHYYPRFDIEEHEHTYELYGDLPGAQQASLRITTMDDHTIEISGSTARHTPTDSSDLANGTPGDDGANGIPRADSVPITQRKPAAAHAEHATTENEQGNSKASASPAVDNDTDGGELQKTHCQHNRPEEATTPAKEVKVRYLMRERQSGEFHRYFPFINAIRENEVTARFHNGTLHVTVPKGPVVRKNEVEIFYGGGGGGGVTMF